MRAAVPSLATTSLAEATAEGGREGEGEGEDDGAVVAWTPLVDGRACGAPLAPATEQDHGPPPAQGGGFVLLVQEEEEEEEEEASSSHFLVRPRRLHSEICTLLSLSCVFVLPEEYKTSWLLLLPVEIWLLLLCVFCFRQHLFGVCFAGGVQVLWEISG